MARQYLELGPTPCDEDCQQVGTKDYDDQKALAENRRYQEMLQKKWPKAHLGIKSFPHDFGGYREVVVFYDDNNPEDVALAFEIENNLPATWDEYDK